MGFKWDIKSRIATHTADLDAHTKNQLEVLRTGHYHITGRGSGSAALIGANVLWAIPFIVVRDMTVDRIAIEVAVLAAGASARLGIYNNGTNLYPGTLLLDAGTVSVATTGIKTITINQALPKGIYWMVVVSDGNPSLASLYIYYMSTPILGLRTDNFLYSYLGWSVAFNYAALPNPFTAGGNPNQTNNAPIVAVRISSLD